MKRVRLADDVVLYRGDSLEVLPQLDETIDAVITDPPFNVGKDFANDNLDVDSWVEFCEAVANAFQGLHATNYLVEMGKVDTAMRTALDACLPYRWTLALNYTAGMDGNNGAVGFSNFGLVLWYGHKIYRRYMDRLDAPLERKGPFNHPTPKGLRHYRLLVDMFSPEDGVVCDPFMGTGTTGIVSVLKGRGFIGVELDDEFFDVSVRRISRALASRGKAPKGYVKEGFLE